MKKITIVLIGIAFGFILTKGEVISWYRIFEMFRFESFHMYGIIGSAVAVSLFFNQLIKRKGMKDAYGNKIEIQTFYSGVKRYLLGGTIFGLGWALTGACPGPLYALVGNGAVSMIAAILGAMLGVLAYGILQKKLPH